MVDEIHQLHPYLNADSLLLVPVAHTILRGLVKALLSFALTTTSSTLLAQGLDARNNPVVLTAQQKRDVEVCSVADAANPNYMFIFAVSGEPWSRAFCMWWFAPINFGKSHVIVA
jgi:hypothetical protein